MKQYPMYGDNNLACCFLFSITKGLRMKCCLQLLILLVLGLAPILHADEQPFSVASVLVDKEALDRPHDIELLGDLAIIPGKGGSLAIVDVTSPSAPKLIWSRHDETELEEAETVLVEENRWDSKAIKLNSAEPWPRVWLANDGGEFDSFEYSCFLTLSPAGNESEP